MNTSKPIHAQLPTGPVSLAFWGIAFARVWLSLVFISPGVAAVALNHAVFDLGYVFLAIVAVVGAGRLGPLSHKPWASVVAASLMTGASAIFVATMALPLPAWVGALGAVLGGVGYSTYLLLNAEMLAGVSILRAVLYISGGRALASILYFLLCDLDPARLAPLVLVLPAIAVALTRTGYSTLPTIDRQPEHAPRFALPWRLIALVGVFSFAYGLRQASLAYGAGAHSSLSTGIVMGVVFLSAYFLSHRIDVAQLARFPMPIMVCGLLLIPAEGLLGTVVSSYFISIAYTLVGFLVSILLLDIAKRSSLPIAPMWAAMNAMQAFVLLGNRVGSVSDGILGGFSWSAYVTPVLVCVAVVVLFLLLFSERDLQKRWGARVISTSLADEDQTEAKLIDRCDALVAQYGLTARETEILHELAHGKDNASIAANLMIAPGTLKAHTRHIYEKCGIHTRAELDALLGLG